VRRPFTVVGPAGACVAAQDELMNEHRPRWTWLFFAQLALVAGASALATSGHFPVALFRSPIDKVGHLVAYGGLSFLAVAFFGRERRWRVVVTLLVVATLEELSQRALRTRTFDLADLAMNVIGICAFGAAVRFPGPLADVAPGS
jgi:VanZ family protein